MEISEKIDLVNILNELVRKGELAVSDPETEELLSGEDIRIVCMKGEVIHICLSKSISKRRAKEKKNKERRKEEYYFY